ncbi:MAG: hypothetical protein KGJ86_06370 [Chloroflexota bacterium]|nr:hypothetical protein [Chloroflexota bacterium]
MVRRLCVVLAAAFIVLVAPVSALAQTSSIAGILANLDAALAKVAANDAAGALNAVNAADKMFDDLEKTLERQNLAAERTIEDNIDASKTALSASPPDFSTARQKLQAARAAAAQFSGAAAGALPKTGGNGEAPAAQLGWVIAGLFLLGLAGLAWVLPGSRFMGRRPRNRAS